MFGWILFAFMLGLGIGIARHILHLKIIVRKANDSSGASNIEFLFGEPYAIVPESEYVDLLVQRWKHGR